MNVLMSWFGSELCRNLVTALAHTLWLGALVACLLYAYLRTTPAEAANKRYWAGVISLIAIVLGGLVAWSVLNYEPTTPPEESSQATMGTPRAQPASKETHSSEPPTREKITSTSTASPSTRTDWHVWATGIWMIGVAIMLLRAMAVVVGASRLQRRCLPVENEAILSMVEQLRRQMRIGRRIRVVAGEHLSVPGVVGCLWPTLLLPVAMVSGMPADDLQAILAHELAHIRRFDYLVNFYQMVIEALLFFNPAVWWISRQVRIEREACCDAAGVALTGRRTQYAQALVSWAQKLRDQHVAATAAIVSLTDGKDESKLVDRIKRIVIAGHRPNLRVSWPTALAMVLLSLLGLALLWQGTDLAVTFAGRILTPQERIEKITEIAQEYGIPDREYGDEDKVLVSGTIKTFDGHPFPGRVRLTVDSERTGYGTSVSMRVRTKDQPLGTATFGQRIAYGRMGMIATAEGYAPAFAGPFEPEPGGNLEGIELVLEAGFPIQMRVVDESGDPIEGAEILGGYPYRANGSYHHSIKLTTDHAGIARHEHAAARTARLRVEADGFELERLQDVTFKPGEISTITLRAVTPASGIIFSETTGEPIAGATIRLMFSEAAGQTYCETGIYGEPDAITDAEGRFALMRLHGYRKYLVLVQADGYGHQYLSNLRAGDNNIKIELGPSQTIRGTILGALDTLDTDKDGKPCVHYSNHYELGNTSDSGSSKSCPVNIKDGVGHFEITDFYGQKVDINVGGEHVSIDVEEDDLDNVVINLSRAEKVMREVVLVFRTPADSPAMQGGVRINTVQEGDRAYKSNWIDVVDGQAQCEVPVPCRFTYNIDYHRGKRPVGYWFRKDPNHMGTSIPMGEGPFTIEVPVHPAGAIYGRILCADGTVATDAYASLIVTKKPAIVRTGLHDLGDALDRHGVHKGQFNATPLPLGGEYTIVARLDNYFHATKPLRLDRKHQIVEHNIQLSQGVTLEGRLLDVDGLPARDMLRLHVSAQLGETSWRSRTSEIRPDENGSFTFENVNPDFRGKHIVRVSVRPGYRPVAHEVRDVKKPVMIQLERGERLTGVVIDDATGWPVPGAQVHAYYREGKGDTYEYENLKAESKTNERGEFIFSNMAARQYRLIVGEANLADSRHPVTATRGQKEPIVLRIVIHERSKLKPRKPSEN